jgi:hypothetical protein
MSSASFQDEELGAAVDVQINKGIFHGIQMTRLACQIEQIVLAFDQDGHAELIPNIRDVDPDSVLKTTHIEQVTTEFRDQTVHGGYESAQLDQPPRKIASYKAQAAGDKNLLPIETLKMHASNTSRT